MNFAWSTLAAAALWIFSAIIAEAHVMDPASLGGLQSGFVHPLTGPDHFLAMFAVGLWGAQMGGRAVWTLPVNFPLVMTVGGIAGMLGVSVGGVEVGIALSLIGLGSAIALKWRPYEWAALLLVGAFALCHGYAHGVELPGAVDPAAYAIGFVMATGLIHIAGIAVAMFLLRYYSAPVRALGAIVCVSGFYFLAIAIG